MRKSKLILVSCSAATVVGVMALIRNPLFGGPQYDGKETLFGRTYIVTGATSGIGRATVDALAARGARVILAGRNEEEGLKAIQEIHHETYNKQVVFKHLDLSSLTSVRDFAADVMANEPRLDALVNNAGVKEPQHRQLTNEGFELQLGVNHLGHFLLTYLLIGKLQSSSPSRIVNLTDISHRRGEIDFANLNSESDYEPAKAYKQSKLAQAVFTKELHRRLTGARSVIYCLLSPDIADKSGGYFKDCEHRKFADTAEDAEIAKRLWMISEVWTGIRQMPVTEAKSDVNVQAE